MRVIVVGLGEVGQHIARTLSSERHDVTVVDRDPARVEAAQGDLDALVVAGNGASPRFLHDIEAGNADLVCGVTNSDESNVITALAAHQLGARRTVARVRDPEYFADEGSFARDVFGIDFVINPERATAEDLAAAIRLPGSVHAEDFVDGKVTVAEIVLTARSPVIGHAIGERRPALPHAIAGLVRNGRVVAAEPGHRPKVGDHLIVAAAHKDVNAVVAHLAGQTSQVRDVVIFGGGRIGLPLARALEDKFSVTVMESDLERARTIAESLRKATVLHEEGVGKDALLQHGVDRAGAFVACAGDDRANLLAALNAKQVGAGLSLAVVSREEFTPLVDALHIDAGFSPRLVTAEAILRAVRGADVEEVHLLLGGAELLDIEVDAGSRAVGKKVANCASMAVTRIAVIVRDGRVVIPDENHTIRAGDRVITFNAKQGVSDVVATFKA